MVAQQRCGCEGAEEASHFISRTDSLHSRSLPPSARAKTRSEQFQENGRTEESEGLEEEEPQRAVDVRDLAGPGTLGNVIVDEEERSGGTF